MTAVGERPQPICRAIVKGVDLGCGKRPEELPDYLQLAQEMGLTASQVVEREEGTFNRENGHFLCDSCYIRAGSPAYPVSSRRQWIAP